MLKTMNIYNLGGTFSPLTGIWSLLSTSSNFCVWELAPSCLVRFDMSGFMELDESGRPFLYAGGFAFTGAKE